MQEAEDQDIVLLEGRVLLTEAAALEAVALTSPPGQALPQVLIGDEDYYGRFFGFSATPTQRWHCPGPFERHRLLARCASLLAPDLTASTRARPAS